MASCHQYVGAQVAARDCQGVPLCVAGTAHNEWMSGTWPIAKPGVRNGRIGVAYAMDQQWWTSMAMVVPTLR